MKGAGQLPQAELQKQREEIRRSLLRVTTAGAVIVLVVLALAIAAVMAAYHAGQQARLADSAATESRHRLWESRLAQARAVRLNQQAGRRLEALAAIREAARVRPSRELRDEAVAALGLVDLGQPEWVCPRPADGIAAFQHDPRRPRFGPNLERVAWGLTNGGIRIVGGREPQAVQELPGPGPLQAFSWSDKGGFLAARYERETWVWDLNQGTVVLKIGASPRPAGIGDGIAFSPDDRLMALSENQEVVIYQLPDGAQFRRLSLSQGSPSFCFHPQLPWLALCQPKGMEIWDYAAERRTNVLVTGSSVHHAAWSPNGRLLAAGCSAGTVFVWEVFTGDRNVLETARDVEHVAFSHDNAMLVSTCWGGATMIWDALTVNAWVLTLRAKGIQFNNDGSRLGFWQPDAVGAWPVARPGRVYTPLTGRMDHELGRAIDFSPDERWMVSVGRSVGGVWLWDLDSEQIISTRPTRDPHWVQFLPDGLAAITVGPEGVYLWPVEDDATGSKPTRRLGGGKAFELPEGTRLTGDAALSPDGRQLAVNIGHDRVALLDVRTLRPARVLDCQPGLWTLCFSADGTLLATSTFSGAGTCVWDLASGKAIHQIDGLNSVVAFSPEGRWLVNSTPTHFEFWETAGWTLAKRLAREEPVENPGWMAFSKAGNLFACIPSQLEVRLFDARTLEELTTIKLPNQLYGRRVRFSPRGTYLGIYEKDNVHLWRLPALRQELAALGLDWADGEAVATPAAKAIAFTDSETPPHIKTGKWAGVLPAASGTHTPALTGQLLALVVAAVGIVIVCALFLLHRQKRLMAAYMQVDGQIEDRNRQLEAAHSEVLQSQKMKALGTLAAGIAHDFNNLLSVIRMSNQLTAEAAQGDPDVAENAAEIEQAVQQGKKVVRSMLGYSRAHSETNETVELPELVEDTVGLLSKQFLSGIALTINFEPGLPPVQARRGQLEQILLNLVVNAAEAMEGRGNFQIIARRVTEPMQARVLRPRAAPAYVELLVSDSGPGIPNEVLPRIFEPFFTTKNVGASRGTGLGLSMVYRMAELDGLGLGVETRIGQGTTFRVILPAGSAVREMHIDREETSG